MKKISTETTRYMMDAMAFAIDRMILMDLTEEELDETVRSLMKKYCEREGIEPDYTNIYSPANIPELDSEEYYDDDYYEEDNEDEDDEEDEDDDDEDDITSFSDLCVMLRQLFGTI